MAQRAKWGVSLYLPNHPLNKGDASLEQIREHCINCYYCAPLKAMKQVAEVDMSGDTPETSYGEPKLRNTILKCRHERVGVPKPRKRRGHTKTYVKPLLITKAVVGKCKLLKLQHIRPSWNSIWRRPTT